MTAVLIVDGAYLLKAAHDYGHFDYLKLRDLLAALLGQPFAGCYYLNSVSDAPMASQDRFHRFMRSELPHGAGFTVKLYDIKQMDCRCPACGTRFGREVQKGVDVGIATLMLTLAMQNAYDDLVLCAGDGDFADAITYVVETCGKTLTLAGFSRSLSQDLRASASRTIFLESHWTSIAM